MKCLINGLLMCLIAAAVTPFAIAQPGDQPSIGQVSKIQGTVSASFGDVLRPLAVDSPVYFNDRLRTGPNARLAITLNDDSELTLGPVSSLVIDEYVYTPKGNSSRMKLNLVNGMMRFVGGKMENAPDADITINTPVATLGIRGTDFITDTVNNSIWVREGIVDATSKVTGESVTLVDDEATTFAGGPCLIMILPRAEKKRRLDYLSFFN